MIALPRLYQQLVVLIFTFSPLLLVVYLHEFQTPPLIYKDFLFHELVVLVAVAIGAFVTYVSYACYQRGRELVMFFLTLAFLAFTLIYAPHGFLTRTAVYHPPLFLLFGPMSRLGMAIFFALAMTKVLHSNSGGGAGSKPLGWRPWFALIGVLMVLVPVHAYLSGPLLHPIRYAMEASSIVIFGFGLFKLTQLYRESALYPFILVAVALFMQSCVVFIIAKPFEHTWWLAHLIFASGFLVLGYGVVQIYRGTGSFSHVFIDNLSLERISRLRVQTMSSLAELLDSLPLVILEWKGSRKLSEKIQFINAHGRKLASKPDRLTQEPTLAEWIEMTVDPADRDAVRDTISSDTSPVASVEFRSMGNGQVGRSNTLLSISLGSDWLGNTVWRAVGVDITAQKHAEQQHLMLQQRLAKSARMQAMAQLSGGLSHEINNMLGPILMGVELALIKIDTSHEARPLLEAAKKGATRIKELVERILNSARETEDQGETTLVDQSVRESVETFRSSAPKGVDFKLELNEPEVRWPCRRIELWQILANLLANSVDALPANGGRIEVVGKKNTVGGVDGYTITVRDDGEGIDPELLDRVTDPFFTTKDVGKGNGLGLTLVSQVIASHKGALNIRSDIHEGTSVDVFMPCAES